MVYAACVSSYNITNNTNLFWRVEVWYYDVHLLDKISEMRDSGLQIRRFPTHFLTTKSLWSHKDRCFPSVDALYVPFYHCHFVRCYYCSFYHSCHLHFYSFWRLQIHSVIYWLKWKIRILLYFQITTKAPINDNFLNIFISSTAEIGLNGPQNKIWYKWAMKFGS